MKHLVITTLLLGLIAVSAEAQSLEIIQDVKITHNRVIQVNDKPFFPIMIWLQAPENFDKIKAAGMNTVAGYWPGSGGTKDVVEYQGLVKQNGFYGVLPFDKRLKGNTSLLAYIHGDEPDLTHKESDIEIVPGSNLAINKSTPLWKIFDGVWHSWSVIDPMEKGQFTLKLEKEVTVSSLGIWVTTSKGLAVAKDISFVAHGREILKATLEAKKGEQRFDLTAPVRFQDLTVRVLTTYPGENQWGSIGEIAGYDKDGRNVLLSVPREVPRKWPEATLKEYRRIKAADDTRPIFMTLTGYFLPLFNKRDESIREETYRNYIKSTDVIGYDIYPIYGWNKPEWLHLVHDGTKELVRLAGNKPVYAWIETSRGGQYTGALERQKPVTPTHIRGEVWMAICRGATAIGYFTHIWKPSYKQFGVPEENARALKEINDQITRLSPAILAPPAKINVGITMDNNLKADIMAKKYDGSLYLFAVNYDSSQQPGKAAITVTGLKAGTVIEVVDENRTITSQNGTFQDEFGPLGVHIYKIKS